MIRHSGISVVARKKNGLTEHSPLPASIAGSPPARLASACFGAVVGIRNALYDRLPFLSRKAPRPVISIGGIRAGGTGKTPLTHLVGRYLIEKGFSVAFLSRGYGRNDKRVRVVQPYETVDWELIGDEPSLLHARLPQSWLGIGPHRYDAAVLCAQQLPRNAVFVADDGFQHRSLQRDLDLVCLHDSPFGDRLLPAGYLREPGRALTRAHAIILIGPAEKARELEEQRAALRAAIPDRPIFLLFQEMDSWINAGDGRSCSVPPLANPLVVCGIARPERFLEMVKKTKIAPCSELIFPDHHRYNNDDFDKTHKVYSNGIVTTEKDAIRLKEVTAIPVERIWYLTIKLRFACAAEEKLLYSLIDKGILLFSRKGG